MYIVPIHYNTKPQLVLAKAKIIGINKEPKVDTIPKLELMAILIGANIANYCLDALFSIEIESLYLWNDSRTALSWCSSYDIKEEFVSNRVRQIRNLAPKAKLMYVESARNSADILTRQPKAKDLLQNNCWWNGPEFLLESRTQWPIQNPEYNLMPEETMKTNENLTTSGEKMLDLIKLSKASKNLKEKELYENELAILQLNVQIEKVGEPADFEGFPNLQTDHYNNEKVNWKGFKSLKHILRVYAKVYRIIEIWRMRRSTLSKVEKNEHTPLTAVHFRKAKQYLIKQMQCECYESELQTLQQGKIVNYGNCKSFRLYLDECGIIRCKGRFEYSPTMKDINFPILYGTKHFFTNLTLWNIHQKENCPGYSYTLHEIKKHMYFPKLKITLKKIFSSCAKCL